jgi:hypothetical protein
MRKTTFSCIRIVAHRTVDKIFPDSYEFTSIAGHEEGFNTMALYSRLQLSRFVRIKCLKLFYLIIYSNNNSGYFQMTQKSVIIEQC